MAKVKSSSCMLTTIDNPFDPFTEFENWWFYDAVIKGYNSSAYLDRIAKTSEQLTDEENDIEIERAIDEIIKYDFTNLYKKVKDGPTSSPSLVKS